MDFGGESGTLERWGPVEEQKGGGSSERINPS